MIIVDYKFSLRVPVYISLEKGFYLLGSDSGEGKSYAYSLLKGVEAYDSSVSVCLLSGSMSAGEILSRLQRTYDIIFLDRGDMLEDSSVMRELLSRADESVVLLDIKNTDNLAGYYPVWADVIYDERGIAFTDDLHDI